MFHKTWNFSVSHSPAPSERRIKTPTVYSIHEITFAVNPLPMLVSISMAVRDCFSKGGP